MPSSFCRSNPFAYQCSSNPEYQPSGTVWTNPLPSTNVIPNVVYFPTSPTQPQQSQNPNVVITGGGGTVQSGVFSQTLQAILSGIALFQRQPYVPTAIQPAQPTIVYQEPVGAGNYGAGYTGGSGGTALGKVELWIKNNTGAAAIIGGGILLLLINPKMLGGR